MEEVMHFTGTIWRPPYEASSSLLQVTAGYKAQDIVYELNKLDKAGISYHISYLNGLSGEGNGSRAAINTAAIYNKINPISISIVAFTVFPESELYDEIQKGLFIETSEIEKLREQKTLIENLNIKTMIYANTVSNTAPISGKLPQDKDKMLKHLQNVIDTIDENTLRYYRNGIVHL